jgi:hypothetical protein
MDTIRLRWYQEQSIWKGGHSTFTEPVLQFWNGSYWEDVELTLEKIDMREVA